MFRKRFDHPPAGGVNPNGGADAPPFDWSERLVRVVTAGCLVYWVWWVGGSPQDALAMIEPVLLLTG